MNIAIAGFAREGKSNLKYFQNKFPEAKFTIFDERGELNDVPVNCKTVLGAGVFGQIDSFDLVLRSAGVAPHKIAQKTKVWSSTREFFAECPALIIGVTGTKGKGTTCTMIRDILQADSKNVFLVGNIGLPALDRLSEIKEDDIVVFEMSSFQLWDLDQSPQIAVVLRIEADHLDIHDDLADYVNAKSNIARHQTKSDKIVFYENSRDSCYIAGLSPGRKVCYPGDISFDTSALKVPGAHYVENAKAAIAAVNDIINDQSSIEKGLGKFHSMPHRLEMIRELNGVKYYDDNFSASFPSLEVAVRAFPNNELILIAGGKDRSLNNYFDIANVINNSTVKQVFLIGETAPRIAESLNVEYKICSTLTEAVTNAQAISQPDDIILMSPGAPSFDMFESFEDRGEKFQELVRSLK